MLGAQIPNSNLNEKSPPPFFSIFCIFSIISLKGIVFYMEYICDTSDWRHLFFYYYYFIVSSLFFICIMSLGTYIFYIYLLMYIFRSYFFVLFSVSSSICWRIYLFIYLLLTLFRNLIRIINLFFGMKISKWSYVLK